MFSVAWSIVALLLVVSGNLSTLAIAAATEESVLSCNPSQVEINQAVVCYINVRDANQEPSTDFSANDFSIRVVAQETTANPSISTISVNVDVARFTVSSATGTNLRIMVVIKATNTYIRGSGATASVLMWPASVVGSVSCSTPALELRSTTTCVAPLYGPNSVHAALHSSDVQFSEAHGFGTFMFLSGASNLVFNFSAPANPPTMFGAYTFRIRLLASNTVFTHDLPVAYPQLQATARSILICSNSSGSSVRTCGIKGIDTLGPVRFNQSNFNVVFERNISGLWVDVTPTINKNFTQNCSTVGTLVFQPKIDNEIYQARLSVYVGKAAIFSSPFVFQMGEVPTASKLTLRGCSTHFVVTGNTTMCTIDVADGVTADPKYVTLTTSLGGTVVGPTFGRTATNNSILTFTYSPPSSVDTWAQEFIGANVGGEPIVSSPFAMVVFQSELGGSTAGGSSAAQIVIFLFLALTLLVGAAAFWFRWDKIAIMIKDFREPLPEALRRPKAQASGGVAQPTSIVTRQVEEKPTAPMPPVREVA